MSRILHPALLGLLFAVLIASLFVSGLAYAATSWPGQSGNPVGYAAYGPLGTTPWPGGAFRSGTAANPTVYTGYVFAGPQTISGSYIQFISCDFNSGTGGVNVTGSNITFTGDRFQSNNVEDDNVQISGGTNITFSYVSFTPLTSFYTAPPGSVWPSAGAGQNTTTQTTDVNAINGNDGYEYGLNIISGGPVTVDHCDFWGFGNAVVFYSTTAQMNITNNWIHDAANASSQGYHTDGPGYLNGGSGPSNVLVQGNVIASLGNTNGLAFQAATSGYNNIQLVGNYLSGFGFTVAAGAPGNTHLTNSSVTQNVWGTDVEPVWNPLYGNSWTAGTNSTWTCNTLAFRAGTTWTDGDGWTPASGINGQYFVPTSGISSTTDYLGNASCPNPQSPVPESGQISSTFIIDYVGGSSVTEIDAPEIEGLSARSNNIEWDIWKNGVSTVPSPEFNVLANPEAAFHIYKFVWQPASITFYIDGTLVSTGTSGIPSAPAVIDINFYGTNSSGWGGNATVGVTRFMYVNSVSFTPLSVGPPAPALGMFE